jgi:hypothetical protein
MMKDHSHQLASQRSVIVPAVPDGVFKGGVMAEPGPSEVREVRYQMGQKTCVCGSDSSVSQASGVSCDAAFLAR